MNVRRLNHDLNRLRQFRNWGGPDLSVENTLRDLCQHLERQQRASGKIETAWATVIPADLQRRATVSSFARGLLTVRIADAATRYQIERFLRAGGQRDLERSAGSAIRRVKLI